MPSTEPGTPAQTWWKTNERILAVCIATFLVMVGQGMTSPILPLYAREFGVSTAMVGLTLTVFALARLLLNLPAGTLADRHGRRLLLICGPLMLSVGMFGSGLAQGIWDLLAWRFVAGAGSALYMTAAQLYILDVSSPEQRARNLAFNSGALLGGVALGPAVGGLLSEVTGLRGPFLIVGGLFVGATVYGWFRLAETKPEVDAPLMGSTEEAELKGSRSFLLPGTRVGFVGVCLVSFCLFSVRAGSRGTLVPLLAIDDFGMSRGALGAALGAAGLVGLALVVPAGAAADRFGRKKIIVPSGFAAVIGLLLIAFAGSPSALVVGLFALAFGTQLTGPAQYAFLADITEPDQRGRALGIYRSAGDVGFLLSPPLLGFLADQTRISTAILVNAAIVAASALFFLVAVKEPKRALT